MAKKQSNRPVTAKDVTTAQTNSLAYQGKVKLQVLHGNKVISTRNYLNKGLPDLFKYISHALAGVSYNALRPCKVALFYCTENGQYESPTTFDWNEALRNKALLEVSPYVVYDAAPVVTIAAGDGYSTTFRFKIPFNWLYKKSFNVIGLFTENNTSCAYYLCTKQVDDNLVWETQDLKDVTGNYSLIIEWTMEVSNK